MVIPLRSHKNNKLLITKIFSSGDPIFDKLEADLAKALMSLPASKRFEIGSGFAGTLLKGSEHNDAYYMESGQIRTISNRSGGIQGGISNRESFGRHNFAFIKQN